MNGIDGTKHWNVVEADKCATAAIMAATGCTSLVARVMAARGITAETAGAFLNPSLERDWDDPYLIPGMSEAIERILLALEHDEKIVVFGDFDVDGLSATTVMTLGLRRMGAHVTPFIPRRFDEGYGLSEEAIDRVIERAHPSLIITVDTGIASRDEVQMVVDRNIDVVVTDHHEPADRVPQGVPVVDPKLSKTCPAHELAGVGVALKVICALGARVGQPHLWREFTDIATLGTVSDMMFLDTENRAIVDSGIAQMRTQSRYGLIALAARCHANLEEVTADSLSYSLIPRLNAAGRISDPELGLNLLMALDPVEADYLADQLEEINDERREIEAELTEHALALVDASYNNERVIVIGGDAWHEGVKGIVASRIVNRYHVPVLLFSISDGVARGSGRSVGQVDLFHAVEQCSDLLIQFGGHAGAVGVTLDAANLDALRERLEGIMETIDESEFEDHGVIDVEVTLRDMNLPDIQSLDALRPYGQGNRVPLFVVRGVVMESRARVGKNLEHFKFVATDGKYNVACIMFKAPHIEALYEYPGAVDIVFEAVAETWQGRTNAKLMVKDIIMRTKSSETSPGAPELVESLFSRAAEIVHTDEFAGIAAARQFHTKVSGVSFGNRQDLIATLQPGDRLEVVREPENPHDARAIAILTECGEHVGYVNRRLAGALAPVIDAGTRYSAVVSEVTGTDQEKTFGLNIVLHKHEDPSKMLQGDETAPSLTGSLHRAVPELTQCSYDELTREITRAFIGENTLHEAQQVALDHLQVQESALCIMATGRGKSLIFHVHAARVALKEQKSSIFVYPLRALIADQAFHIEQKFAELGLVAQTLTGETSLGNRDLIFQEHAAGKIDVILTTPEFLSLHTRDFAQGNRVGFLVVDEAHHVGVARSGHRSAYADLGRVRDELGNPVVLALTATADSDCAESISEVLGIDNLVVDHTTRENLMLDDGRGTRERDARLTSLVARGERTIIYVNSREQSVSLAAMLRKRIWELGSKIAFYNAGLTRTERKAVEQAFREGQLCCIVSTSAFGEGVNLPDVRHVILYHMPFGAVEFNQMAGRAGRDGNEAWVHVLFGSADARINERILSGMAPARKELETLYRTLMTLSDDAHRKGQNSFSKTNAEIAHACLDLDPRSTLGERSVSAGISIFKELNFLTTSGYGSSRSLVMAENPLRVELDASTRYLEGIHAQEAFSEFKEWALSCASPEMLTRFNRPITPDNPRV